MVRILITAGPTREHLDDVRYLTNASTGRMGYAIAAAAVAAGHRVTLVSGPTHLEAAPGVTRIDVISAREMRDRAVAAFADADIAFGVAAVADHRPAHRFRGKPPKSTAPPAVELIANPDVIGELGAAKGPFRVVIGFALESITHTGRAAAVASARGKIARKQLDLCVLNDASALGAEHSAIFLVDPAGRLVERPDRSKADSARELVVTAVDLWQGKQVAGQSAAGGGESAAGGGSPSDG